MLKEFREFAVRGNALDMAVGIIVGAAFGVIVKSLVDDLLMPLLGVVVGDVNFTNLFVVLREGPTVPGPYETLEAARSAGALTLNIGSFLNTVVSFVIVAFALFLFIRFINRFRRRQEGPPAEQKKSCPHCLSKIPEEAVKCAFCTADL